MRTQRTCDARDGRRVTAVALAASLGAHAALLLLLARSERGAPPPAASAPLTVELRSLPAPAPAPAMQAPRAERADPRSGPGARAPGAAAAPLPAPGGEGAPREDGWERLPASLRAAPDLRARPPGGDLARGTERAEAAATPRDPLRAWAGELAGRARVESGVVHPYYGDMGRALLGAWDAKRVVEEGGLLARLAQAGENVAAFGRVWQRSAAGFAAAGEPALVDGGTPRMKELAGLPPGPARDALVQAEVQRQLRPAYSEGHVTRVRVAQAPDGRILEVELVSPSKDRRLDQAALDDVRAAVEGLPPPPAEVCAGRERLVSLWDLEVEISISPPLPMVAVEFDEVLGVRDVRLPLDRRVWKRVRLVSID